jgi:hypothetical protein
MTMKKKEGKNKVPEDVEKVVRADVVSMAV